MPKVNGFLRTSMIALAVSGSALGSTNDAFANSSNLGSVASAVIAYDSRDATRQVNEPAHVSNTSTGSLWWRWTAPSDGQLWLKIAVSGVDSSGARAVYTGSSLAGLNKVTESSSSQHLPVPVISGTTYQIAVADSRLAALSLEFFPLPPNDAFENRTDLGNPADFTLDATTVGATPQSGEPGSTSQGPTLWWSWQAPADGIVTYDLAGSDSDYWNASAYTGSTLATLVKRSGRTSGQAADSPIILRVKAGETFAILMSRMTSGAVGRFRLNWHLAPQPYQATSAEAVDLGTVSSASGIADNRNAITPGDTTYAKLWWRWTAPGNGVFRWTALRNDSGTIQPTPRVFDTNLQQIYQNSTWQAFPCRAGQTFLLSVESFASYAGRFDYQLIFDPSAVNDALADALPLAMGDNHFNSTFAAIEPGEPVIPNFSWTRSLWWHWTAPGDGALWFDMDRSTTIVGVWGIDPVVSPIQSDYFYKQLMVTAKTGDVLRIGTMETNSAPQSPGRFTTRFIPATTGNDHFADAADLGSEWTVAAYGDPGTATREAGDPMPAANGGSLWWKWTAPGDGNVRMRSRVTGAYGDSSNNPGLWLYRGTGIGNLTPMTDTNVTSGETLWVAVTGIPSNLLRPIAFELMGAPDHPNDAFASATDLGGVNTWQPSFYMDATSEPGDPIQQRSLWWKWTAPEAGNVFFSVPSSNATFSVYQGAALANLTLVANSTDWTGSGFVATAGTTYWLAVTGSVINSPVTVDWRLAQPPPGDLFAAPVELGLATSFALAPAAGSLIEPIEAGLFSNSYNQSLWWRWAAPADGKLAKTTLYGGTWLLFEETGGPGAGLTLITDENVIAGRHYRIANIDGQYVSTSPATWLFHAIPSNDVYPGAIHLGSVTAVVAEADLYAATTDADESAALQTAPSPPSHGVWWQWTAPFDGVLKCQGEAASNSLSYVSLAVLQGDHPSTWLGVGGSTSSSFGSVECLTSVKAGITYKILLGVKAFSVDLAKLTLSAWPAASNNDWVDAIDLGSGASTDTSGDNTGATREAFEPNYGSGSVWWKWTASDARNVFVTARIGGSAVNLVSYQLSGAALVEVPGASSRSYSTVGTTTSFRSVPGRTYWFAASGDDPATVGKVELSLRTTAIPANDDFANRIILDQELPLAFSGNTAGATVEANEATYDSNNGSYRNMSLWWSWTAPASGPVMIENTGGSTMYVQTGNSIDSLTTLKRATAGHTAWTATAGITYHFIVASFHHAGAPFECRLSAFAPSSNNNFAARASLGSVTQGQWDVSTLLCSAETGEPSHGGQTATRSVWYEWTAPTSGGILLEAALGGFQARLGIYTGSAVSALQNVAGGSWKVPFATVAGQVYHIAVDGTEGLGSLSVKSLTMPANDLFANRTVLTGWPLSMKGSTMLAGKETGEPGTTAAAQRTVWWEWVAPTSDVYTILSAGSTVTIAVYSSTTPASSFASLSLVTTVGSGTSFLSTTAGRYYYFKVFTTTTVPNGIDFDVRMDRSQSVPPPPPNDSFATRIHLGDQTGVKTTGDFYGATRESWETGSSTQGSLWWSWTAPSDGVFLVHRSGNQPVTMTIYTGSTTDSLVTLATGTGTREWFLAEAGTTYQIRCLSSNTTDSTSSSRLMGLEILSAEPPANDVLAAAVTLPDPGTTTVEGFNAGAGTEASEPSHSGTTARASVWYQWTANVGGPVLISTTSAVMRTGVYQGAALETLSEVASGNTPLTFTATPGEVYRIALDSSGDESFFISLTQPPSAITNDAFAAAVPLSGAMVEVAGTTVGATFEASESYHTGWNTQGGSAWWTWTAPANGSVEVSAIGGTLPHFAIYQGTVLDSLELVASGSGVCGFLATAGTTYRIAATSTNSAGSAFVLNVRQPGNTPPNDAFAHAEALASQAIVTGTVEGASREAGESWHASSAITQTVWYRWTAPTSGRARVSLRGGNPGSLVVYRGSTVAGLSPVISSTIDAGFPVTAGEEFRILIGRASSGDSGPFELEIGMTNTGANDAFANRIDLGSATQFTWGGTLEDATMETGETPHEYDDKGSRWWTWTAPADGGVTLRIGSGRIVPVVHVYTGNQIGSLIPVSSSSSGFNGLAFPVRAGTTYQIALRGKPSSIGIGDFIAELTLQTLPNDNFADATILESVLPVSATGLLEGAGSELGENASRGSVWWRWISPTSGLVDLDTGASELKYHSTEVWTGPGLPLLQSVPLSSQGPEIRRFTATAGTTYWISMSSSQSTVFGAVRFQLRQAGILLNDHFANALPLTGSNITIDAQSYGATNEPGEPVPRSRPYTNVFSRSLWWNWTAPRDGLLRVSISSGWAFLYEGPSWQELREVKGPGGATNTTNSYWVEAGCQYWVSAGNSSGDPCVASLALSPRGDMFADPLTISGVWVKRSGSLTNCFWEAGEPLHAGNAAQATFWFRWIAPSSGGFRVMAKSGANTLRAAAYTGNSISSLVERGSARGDFVFTAVAGQTYYIAVDGGSPAGESEFVLAEVIPAYDAWRDLRFDFMDPSSSPDKDPDHDGLVNLLEASLGSDPLAFTAGPVFTVDEAQEKIRLNMRRQSGSVWRHSFHLSASLGDWQSTTVMNRTETIENHGDGFETLHVLLHDYRVSDYPTLFFRMHAEAPPAN